MNKKFFRNPKWNALILGLLQGVPQGFCVSAQNANFVGPGFDNANFVLLTCFALLGPPVFSVLSHYLGGSKQPKWWKKVSEYVDLPLMIFWGSTSMGMIGWYSLKANNMSEGYAVYAFFIAAGLGVRVASFLESRLMIKLRNAI